MSERNENECRSKVRPTEGEPVYLSGLKLWAVMGAVTLASFIMLLDMTIIVTAIPHITDEFQSLEDIGWYGSAYTLASAILQPITGKLYSNLNTKWTFLTFVVILEIGSLVCSLARSSTVFIAGRVIAGLGTSGIMNGALTIIAVSVPLPRRPAVTGAVIGLAYVGSVGGPLLGGLFTEYVTWRWCFWINMPIGLISCGVLLVTLVPEHSPQRIGFVRLLASLDLLGFSLLGPAVTMVLLAMHYGAHEYPWSSPVVVGLFCGGFTTALLFVLWEVRCGEKALIPPLIVSNRVIWSSCLVTGFMTSTLLVHSYYLPIYFQAVRGVSPSLSGIYLLPSILGQLVSSVLSGFIVGKIGYCLPAILLSGAMTAIGGGLLSTLGINTTMAKWVGYQLLLGFGRGVGIQMPMIAVQAILKDDLIPIGMSLIVFSQTFGGSVFLTIANVVFNNELEVGLSKYAPDLSSERVINAGATGFRSIFPEKYIAPVSLAYSQALGAAFYLSSALAIIYFVFAWGIGKTNVSNKKKEATYSE